PGRAFVEDVRRVAMRRLIAVLRGNGDLFDEDVDRAHDAAHDHGPYGMDHDGAAGEDLLPRAVNGLVADHAKAARVYADDVFVIGPHAHHECGVCLPESLIEG